MLGEWKHDSDKNVLGYKLSLQFNNTYAYPEDGALKLCVQVVVGLLDDRGGELALSTGFHLAATAQENLTICFEQSVAVARKVTNILHSKFSNCISHFADSSDMKLCNSVERMKLY